MTNWLSRKLGEVFSKKPGGEPIFDFYLNDLDVVIGRISDFRKSKLLSEIKNEIERETNLSKLKTQESDHNFGYSADWTQVLVEWFAKDDWVNAIVNLGGLAAFTRYFFSLFGKLREKYNDKLRVGIATARLLAFYAVLDKEGVENAKFSYELIFEREIARQGGFEEKDFVFLIRRTIENRDLVMFFVHVDWFGNAKHFYEI